MNSLKILLFLAAVVVGTVSCADRIRDVVVATSNCAYCGMTFTGTISIKVKVLLSPLSVRAI